VADTATVEGRIQAARVTIRGNVAADVRVTNTLTLYPDASLRGRVLLIDGATLDIRMGALYNGTTLQGDASAQLPARTERRGDGLADEMPVVDWYALDEAPGEASPTEESTEGSTTEEPTTEDAPEAAQDNVPNSPPEGTQDEAAASAPPPPDNTTDSSPNQGAPDAPPSPSRDQDDTPEDSATDAFGMEW
jgi:cytoskeletal protein CcmA (bactofilin family)